MHITDISAVRAIVPKDILICTDNTWLTPIFQNPLVLGSDLVIHSATKYLGGHSDLLGGVVISIHQQEFFEKIRMHQRLAGSVLSPYDCYQLSRSLKTLPVRMRAHEENAIRIAAFLAEHAAVSAVYYPGLQQHPGYDIAKKQASGFGAMISFEISGSETDAKKVVQKTRFITPATSLGGVESTWEHRKSSEGPASETPETLIRLSVGLEFADDLCEDINNALT